MVKAIQRVGGRTGALHFLRLHAQGTYTSTSTTDCQQAAHGSRQAQKSNKKKKETKGVTSLPTPTRAHRIPAHAPSLQPAHPRNSQRMLHFDVLNCQQPQSATHQSTPFIPRSPTGRSNQPMHQHVHRSRKEAGRERDKRKEKVASRFFTAETGAFRALHLSSHTAVHSSPPRGNDTSFLFSWVFVCKSELPLFDLQTETRQLH